MPAPVTTPLAGRYVLLDQVGTGGMGSVWRARDLRSGELVAAKVLGAHDSAMLLRFVREQSLRIRHPHLLTPSGWAADDHRVVFGMDLVRGGSLDELLTENGALPASYVGVLLDQLLQALAAVHTAGVVHRDVKPANLLLEPTSAGPPFLRLGDFGVAVPVEDVRLTRGPAVVGTDGYLAPEQVAGAAPDPRQDLYAAGVVATQLLTGRPPTSRSVADGARGAAPPTALGAGRRRPDDATTHRGRRTRAASAHRAARRRPLARRTRPSRRPSPVRGLPVAHRRHRSVTAGDRAVWVRDLADAALNPRPGRRTADPHQGSPVHRGSPRFSASATPEKRGKWLMRYRAPDYSTPRILAPAARSSATPRAGAAASVITAVTEAIGTTANAEAAPIFSPLPST